MDDGSHKVVLLAKTVVFGAELDGRDDEVYVRCAVDLARNCGDGLCVGSAVCVVLDSWDNGACVGSAIGVVLDAWDDGGRVVSAVGTVIDSWDDTVSEGPAVGTALG